MGITINSKNKSIDMGYIGFMNLRIKVADLAGEDIGEHYRELSNKPYFGEEKIKKFFEDYDKRTIELDEKYKHKMISILKFLYASDCEAKMPPTVCKKIYEVIKNYDDDVAYGYSGRKDCAMFKDFKELVKDCIDNKCYLKWH